MPLRPPCPDRRAGRKLLLAVTLALVAGVGCDALEEPTDDSLRGEGSIHVPSDELRLPLAPAEPGEAPTDDAISQPSGGEPAARPVNSPGFD